VATAAVFTVVRAARRAWISRLKLRPIGVRANHSRYTGSAMAICPSDQPAYRPKSRRLPDGLPGGVVGIGVDIA
jgi:hypothetical protein